MKINLILEATFSTHEDADIFLFIKSAEFGEVAIQSLSLDQIMSLTLEKIGGDDEERREMVEKVKKSVKKFLKKIKECEKDAKRSKTYV